MTSVQGFDYRAQILANLKVLYPRSATRTDVITIRQESRSSYQAIAVEIDENTKEHANLIFSDPDMTSRQLAYSNLLDKTEEMLGSKLHKSIDSDAAVRHVEFRSQIDTSEDYEFVDAPNVDAQVEIKTVTATSYEYPAGSGDEWAHYATTHLKAQQALAAAIAAPCPPPSIIATTHGCPLGTDDEWMYWWSKSLEDKDKADAAVANALQEELCAPRRDFPHGSGDEWAYWTSKHSEDKKRACPRGTNDEWAYWVAEHHKKNPVVVKERKKVIVHERAPTPTRKCPHGTDDQWAYWAWRHSQRAEEQGRTNVNEKPEAVIELKSVSDYPLGSGDMWAHFDRLFRDKQYAAKFETVSEIRCDGHEKRQHLETNAFEKGGNGEDVQKPKAKTSAYAVWLNGLNIE